MRLRTSEPRRWAFTLIEMLVVVALMLILMTIAAAMFPRFAENQRIIKGADQISTMLLNARMRALRDRMATGVRIEFDASGQARQLLFVQQIDDFYKRGTWFTQLVPRPLPQGDTAQFQPVPPPFDFEQSYSTTQQELAPVQHGDYLEVNGGGLVMKIERVLGPDRLELSPTPPTSPRPSTLRTLLPRPYRIIRQPRPVAGEPPVDLPQNIAIEIERPPGVVASSKSLPQRPRPGSVNPYVEIMFAPGGGVVGKGTSSGDNIILWVRDVTKGDTNNPLEGSPLLVSIHTRTGLIAVHPVDPTTGLQFPHTDPRCSWYNFTRDGRSSGL